MCFLKKDETDIDIKWRLGGGKGRQESKQMRRMLANLKKYKCFRLQVLLITCLLI